MLRNALAEARADGVATLARALAFSLFMAIPALFLVLLGAFSLLGGERTVEELVNRTGTVLPEEATTLLEESLRRATEATTGGAVMVAGGLVLGLWTLTSAATTLMEGLTIAFDRRETRGFLQRRLVALTIIAALGTGTLLVFGLLVLGPHLERWIGEALGAEAVVAWVWWTAQWPALVLGLLFAFAVVLYLGPDAPQPRWRLVTPGAVVALLLWLGASAVFSLYAAEFGSYEKTWGTLSAVIVTLLWLWLSSVALLFGARVNAEAQKLAVRQEEDTHRKHLPGRNGPARVVAGRR